MKTLVANEGLIRFRYEASHPRGYIRTESNGERVIVDPGITYSRIYMRYYLLINVGALVGQISMVCKFGFARSEWSLLTYFRRREIRWVLVSNA